MKNASILKLVLVQQLGGRQPDFRDQLFFFFLIFLIIFRNSYCLYIVYRIFNGIIFSYLTKYVQSGRH